MKTLNFKSLYAFVESDPTEARCREYFKRLRWKDGVTCPHCKNSEKKIYEYKNGETFKCSACKRQFSLTKGTIFERTHIPLRKWFLAILMFIDKKPFSSYYLSRELDIAQSNAQYALSRLRRVMGNVKHRKLQGIVEVDESLIGGLFKFRHHDNRPKGCQGKSTKVKAAVLGMLERGGEVRMIPIKSYPSNGLQLIIRSKVEQGSVISTDECTSYIGIERYGFTHGHCVHNKEQYVNGIYHTNSLEGVWGHLKRAIKGTYHSVCRNRLLFYCNEFCFRYNNRKLELWEKFDKILEQSVNVRITKQDLLNHRYGY